MPHPLLAIRGKGNNSMLLNEWNPGVQYREEVQTERSWREPPNRPCRVMKFSNAGSFFVFCNGVSTDVIDTKSFRKITSFDIPKACGIYFSPDDKFMCTLEPYFTNKEFPEGQKNVKIWETTSWKCVEEIKEKSQTSWHPVWFGDSKISARSTANNVFVHEKTDTDVVVSKLHVDKLMSFSLTSSKTPPHYIAAFSKGAKGAPSMVRIFKYPDFSLQEVIASKSFFRADTVEMYWNSKGTAVLIRAATEVDATGASYYGEQSLHYMNTGGDTAIIQLPKKGPIYSFAWDPDATKFCVVYGFMPAKASLFNHKCDVVHDFDPSPKNMCLYNPQGNILLLAGFGNLRGNVEAWHNASQGVKQIGHLEAPDTTKLEWCPDGEHFVTSTTTPRLRVNNGYKVWHYARSTPIAEQKWENELHEVLWQPFPSGIYPAPRITSSGAGPKVGAAAKPQSYVPPHARGRSDYSAAKFKQDEDEIVATDQNLSKSAMKNKKKREAKKKAQQQVQSESSLSQSQRDAVAMAKYLLTNNDSSAQQARPPASGDTEKKLKNLRKKLQNIEKLKQQQKEGKQLEKNQMEKLSTEADIRAQLEKLQMS